MKIKKQKQLNLPQLIEWGFENDVVLDPFIGSGTTALAAMNNNRNYIGFELDSGYCDLANKRINSQKE